jgi:hypothetical protein
MNDKRERERERERVRVRVRETDREIKPVVRLAASWLWMVTVYHSWNFGKLVRMVRMDALSPYYRQVRVADSYRKH